MVKRLTPTNVTQVLSPPQRPLSWGKAKKHGGRKAKTRKMKNRGSAGALSFRFSPGSARLLFTSPRSSPYFPARNTKETSAEERGASCLCGVVGRD